MLFSKDVTTNKAFSEKLGLCGNTEDSIQYMKVNKPVFDNYDDFMRY